MSAKLKFWTGGIMLVIIGLVLAKIISEMYAAQPILHPVIYAMGVIMAIAGLGIIMVGIRK
jgi:hypothetical protein